MKNKSAIFVYRPSNDPEPRVQNATLDVKFAQLQIICDPWFLIGGTKWSRTIYRLKHPIIYLKRGLRTLWRRIKPVSFKSKKIKPLVK